MIDLRCGDCMEIMKILPDGYVDIVVTDPPYGIGVHYSELDHDDRQDYWEWLNQVLAECRRVARITILTHRVASLGHITGWDWIGVWNKPYSSTVRVGNSCIVPHWEPIYMFGIHTMGTHSKGVSDVFTANPTGNGELNGLHGKESHAVLPVQAHKFPKPIVLIESLIESFSTRGATVLDPFMGSGTTGVACVRTGRNFIGIEIDPTYFAIAERRITERQQQYMMEF